MLFLVFPASDDFLTRLLETGGHSRRYLFPPKTCSDVIKLSEPNKILRENIHSCDFIQRHTHMLVFCLWSYFQDYAQQSASSGCYYSYIHRTTLLIIGHSTSPQNTNKQYISFKYQSLSKLIRLQKIVWNYDVFFCVHVVLSLGTRFTA